MDHILTNAKSSVKCQGVVKLGISDHDLIFCIRKIETIKSGKHNTLKTRSFKNYTKLAFVNDLSDVAFPDYSTFKSVNEAYTHFTTTFMHIVDKSAPYKNIRVKGNTKLWFDKDISNIISMREKQKKKFLKSKLHVDFELYKEYRKLAQKAVKKKKTDYIKGKLQENMKNPKELWKTLKDLGLSSKLTSNSKICLEKEGHIVHDTKTNANVFKNFFSELAVSLVNKLPKPIGLFGQQKIENYYNQKNIPQNSFFFQKTSEERVFEILNDIDIKKACGIDNLHGQFLRDGAQVIKTPICQLVNICLGSFFPDQCKIAKLKPLYKKGKKVDPKNYRPISLLPLLSKIIERIVNDQLQCHLEKHNILFQYQSGFRSKHSPNTCLAHLTNQILTGFESKKNTGMILIDLQKAFDTLDHGILIKKLKYFGFSTKTTAWFSSYLTNRHFVVNLEQVLSDKGHLKCGVPQGSILGPLLFLLYVNDMPSALEYCELRLYADDTCIFFSHENITEIEEKLNTDFNRLCEWFIENKLSIHYGEDKTKCILFRQKNCPPKTMDIRRGENNIKQYKTVEYLGVLLDEHLSGESMAIKVIDKINQKIKFLYRQSRYLSPSLRRLLCNSLIQPHFDFGCCSWFPNLPASLKKRLQTSQNKCIRYCLTLKNRDHIDKTHFEKINWLPVEKRFEQCIAVTVFNFKKGICPPYMSEIYKNNSSPAVNTRRSLNSLLQPNYTKKYPRNSLSYLGPKIWNDLDKLIKDSTSTNSFKHALKRKFIKEIRL